MHLQFPIYIEFNAFEFLGMDNESIEDSNMSASRENITIAEDTNDDSMMMTSSRKGVRTDWFQFLHPENNNNLWDSVLVLWDKLYRFYSCLMSLYIEIMR